MKLSKTTQKQLIKVDYKIFKEKIFSLFFNNLVHKVLVYYEQMNYQIQPKYFYKINTTKEPESQQQRIKS